jgi:hypothetical protein
LSIGLRLFVECPEERGVVVRGSCQFDDGCRDRVVEAVLVRAVGAHCPQRETPRELACDPKARGSDGSRGAVRPGSRQCRDSPALKSLLLSPQRAGREWNPRPVAVRSALQ